MVNRSQSAVLALVGALVLTVALAGGALGARNPSGTGQPGAECEDIQPHGFTNSAGFANAETHYAGSEGTASLAHSNSPHAVSQYDVACYQLEQKALR